MPKKKQYRIVFYHDLPPFKGFYFVEEKGWFGWHEVYGTATRADTSKKSYQNYLQCKEPMQVIREWSE